VIHEVDVWKEKFILHKDRGYWQQLPMTMKKLLTSGYFLWITPTYLTDECAIRKRKIVRQPNHLPSVRLLIISIGYIDTL